MLICKHAYNTSLPIILLMRNDFPVPALPVKNTFRLLSTAVKTFFCSTDRVTGVTSRDGVIGADDGLLVFNIFLAILLPC